MTEILSTEITAKAHSGLFFDPNAGLRLLSREAGLILPNLGW